MWCRNKRVDTLNGCNVVARQERTSRVALAVKARIDISLSVKGNKSRCRIATIGSMIRSWNANRSEEHTSELKSLMRISYAVFSLQKKNNSPQLTTHHTNQ